MPAPELGVATAAATDIGFLTTFSKKVGGVFVPFVEMTAMTPPAASRDSHEYTHFGSPDFAREFKPGLTDWGDLQVTYNLIPGVADDAAVQASLGTRSIDAWRVTYPNGATLDFNGFATKYAPATPMADKMSGSATFKVSGKPVMTPAV